MLFVVGFSIGMLIFWFCMVYGFICLFWVLVMLWCDWVWLLLMILGVM